MHEKACRKRPFRLEKNNLFWTGFFAFKERKLPMAEKKEMEPAEEKVVEIETERLRAFENHPFKRDYEDKSVNKNLL